ncbi:flocculation protein FLO11-like [Ananas comosus]|uniref:Flocculation protein FLO11-like n=1 Tax=Ananas comosus TaxID=4615 RepID=A0A6P5EUU7_ANACO|nr:flocculation protein FLO11-like [Ananas comosus]
MNRLRRDSPVPVRGRKPAVAAAQLLLRQGKPKDESLDLFSAIRRSESPTISSPAAAAAVAEEGVLGRSSGVDDDDLFYADVAKTDYDWLLTPPGTPLFSSCNGVEHQPSSASAKSTSRVRSGSATKPSRLSVSHPPEIDTTTRSGRTSSAASSSASSNCTSSSTLSTTKSSLLSRSSASVVSKLSPTPHQTATRPDSAPMSTRLPSPARSRHKPSLPSTPIARPRALSTASSPRSIAPASRPNPRQSTPTRRAPARSASVARAVVQPDATAKIKTKPTERPQSTGKQRSVTPASSNRNRNQENSTKKASPIETKRPLASNTAVRISAKPSSPAENNGFGRNISKIRHTDIRQGAGGIRGASLYPHSIRSTAAKSHKPALRTTTTDDNGSSDRAASECGSSINGTIAGECAKTEASESGDSTTSTKPQERKFAAARASELDLYGSTRYDMMLLKEDARNLNWLRSVDDVSAESPTFHRFEPLPEPFGLV